MKFRRDRESVRIAKATKKLLSKFLCVAQYFSQPQVASNDRDVMQVRLLKRMKVQPDVVDADVLLTEEVFHLVLQDQEVQILMLLSTRLSMVP